MNEKYLFQRQRELNILLSRGAASVSHHGLLRFLHSGGYTPVVMNNSDGISMKQWECVCHFLIIRRNRLLRNQSVKVKSTLN